MMLVVMVVMGIRWCVVGVGDEWGKEWGSWGDGVLSEGWWGVVWGV